MVRLILPKVSAMLGWPLLALLAGCGGGSSDGGSPSVPMGPPGTLDATFGTGGVVLSTAGLPTAANAMVVQPDGKIVVAGSVGDGAAKSFYLVRYNLDGTLDAGFGIGGTVTTVFGAVAGGEARAVVLQADGKIVAVGGSSGACALARYNADGSLDSAFGNGGMVLSRSARDEVVCTGAMLQTDGKIVAAVLHGPVGYSDLKGSVMRFDPNGSRDSNFGVAGEADFGCQATSCEPTGVAIRSDGRILVSGMEWFGAPFGGETRILLAQFDPDGTPDPKFGDAGFAVLRVPVYSCFLTGLALDPDGKAVVLVLGSPECGYALHRLNVDGSLDAGFGINGNPENPMDKFVSGNGIALQSNGKIVVAGYIGEYSPDGRFQRSAAVIRYTPSGVLDSGFGNAGVAVTPVAGVAVENAVASVPDGRIVIAGNVTSDSAQPGIFVARYFGDPAATAAH